MSMDSKLNEILNVRGIKSLSLKHKRVKRFRWMFLVEFPFRFLLLLIWIPLYVILSILDGDDNRAAHSVAETGIDDMGNSVFDNLRVHNRFHSFSIRALGEKGEELDLMERLMPTRRAGDEFFIALLKEVKQRRIVLEEQVGSVENSGVKWFGTEPFFAEPELPEFQVILKRVQELGLSVEEKGGKTTILREHSPAGVVEAVITLILCLIFSPIGIFFKGYRHQMLDSFYNILRVKGGAGSNSN